MLNTPMDILEQFPVRKSKKQKEAFREEVQGYAEGLGYSVAVEKGSFGSRNVVIGDPKTAKYLVTAHYDTPARRLIPNLITPCNRFLTVGGLVLTILLLTGMAAGGGYLMWQGNYLPGILLVAVALIYTPLELFGPANPNNANDNTSGVVTVLETMRTMPVNQRHKICFVLFDLEEGDLIGSKSYRRAHKEETDHQIVLNLDCVGDGDEILFMPSEKIRKDPEKIAWLYKAIGRYGDKTIDVREKGFVSYDSDQKKFPYGVAIGAFHRSKWWGLYFGRIHTSKDTVLEITNVNILRACLTSLIGMDAAQ